MEKTPNATSTRSYWWISCELPTAKSGWASGFGGTLFRIHSGPSVLIGDFSTRLYSETSCPERAFLLLLVKNLAIMTGFGLVMDIITQNTWAGHDVLEYLWVPKSSMHTGSHVEVSWAICSFVWPLLFQHRCSAFRNLSTQGWNGLKREESP